MVCYRLLKLYCAWGRYAIIVCFLCCCMHNSWSQKLDFSKGEPILKVFSNFHASIEGDEKESSFEVKRAYLGYNYSLDNEFRLLIKLDIGSPDDVSPYSLIRRYAYFKNAAIEWVHDDLSVSFGIIDLNQFKLAEKLWGHRYIYKSFQDAYRFGPSADIGMMVKYSFTPHFSMDMAIMNGEGYTSLQADNTFKTSLGITYDPFPFLSGRIYYDYSRKSQIQSSLSTLLSLCIRKKVFLTAEYNHRYNESFLNNYERYGYSIYLNYFYSDRIVAFGRFDKVLSSILDAYSYPWNLAEDGSALIAGLEYHLRDNIAMSLNYQDWYPYAKNASNVSYIFFNLEYSL